METQYNTNEQEAARQKEIMERLKVRIAALSESLGRPLTYCSVCFGCQMNAKDSEKLEGILETIGYEYLYGEGKCQSAGIRKAGTVKKIQEEKSQYDDCPVRLHDAGKPGGGKD